MKRIWFMVLSSLILVAGCEQKKEIPKIDEEITPATAVQLTVPQAKSIFNEPMPAHTFELPSAALQVWRHTRSVKPALVLLSIHPFLDPIATERKNDITDLIRTGDADIFRRRGSYYRVNPALVPTQALSAAINNELFSELIWVTPTRAGIDEISLEVLRDQLVNAGFLSEAEGESLFYADGVTSGTVRGLPFRAVHPDAMPELDKPIVLHIDTGYFKGLFKNEVATPLYDILHQTVQRIMQNEWQVYATTLSWSTEELMFSLDVRFIITALAKMIEDPNLLQNMPQGWKLHADAMYMGNMYMESKAQDLIAEAAIAAPDDPTIVYALSRIRFQQGRADEAFTLLDKAMQLDHGYAAAYLQLADTNIKNGHLKKALELLRKAIKAYPENPFLKIREADILIRMKQTDQAITAINGLQLLPWSPYFHGNAAANLNDMAEYARNPEAAEAAAPTPAPQTGQEKK
ncbi:MAG: hypothetical protein C0623_07960 [Desulfuromonas sp.]|nr:MAG: hypothetical protein C0623_07960 [Desulfuromonas sp.]